MGGLPKKASLSVARATGIAALACFAKSCRTSEGESTRHHMLNQSVQGADSSYALRTNFGFLRAALCPDRRIGHLVRRSPPTAAGLGVQVSSDSAQSLVTYGLARPRFALIGPSQKR